MSCAERYRTFIEALGGETLQNPAEVEVVYHMAEGIRPAAFLEIGSAHGGTLFVYAGACAPGATLIAVDDAWKPHQAATLEKTMARLVGDGFDAHWVRGNSHDPAIAKKVKAILAGRPVDFLHVDGNHAEASVMADWEAYGPLVRPGGLVAFHDIAFTPEPGARASWDRIKITVRVPDGTSSHLAPVPSWVEIIGAPCPVSGTDVLYPLGVGVLWRP